MTMTRMTRLLPVAVVAIALVAVGLIAVRELRGDETDPVVAKIPVGQIVGLAAGDGAIWAADLGRGRLAEVRDDRVAGTVRTGEITTNPAYGEGSVWVPAVGAKRLVRVDPATREVQARIAGAFKDVAVGEEGVWAVTWRNPPPVIEFWRGQAVAEIDPATNRIVRRISLDGIALSVATGGGSVWVTSFDREVVWRIDPASGRVTARIDVGAPQARAVFAEGALWVTVNRGSVVRIDPATDEVTDRVELGTEQTADYIAYGEGSVWVAAYDSDDRFTGTLVEIDPATAEIRSRLPVGLGPQGLAVAGGYVWVGHYESASVWQVRP
jgi:virginiamycin B lyase